MLPARAHGYEIPKWLGIFVFPLVIAGQLWEGVRNMKRKDK